MAVDLAVLFEALSYASKMHAQQRRKDKEASPYINHPIDVANILVTVGNIQDTSVLAAAILHDTIEDTEASEADLIERFGEDIASLVMECTDDKSLPKDRRKQLQIEHAPHKSPRAKHIKIADKISNVRDLSSSPPKDWPTERVREYLDWSEKVVNGLGETNQDLLDFYRQTLENARKSLSD